MTIARLIVVAMTTALVACGGDDSGGGATDGPPRPDAPRGDGAPTVDARIDASEVDAGSDASEVDAPMVDAPIVDAPIADAAVDASVTDAPPPDAPPPVDPPAPCGQILPTGDVLLDNGVDAVHRLRRRGDRVLAIGPDRWALFDTVTRSIVASGALPPYGPYEADIAGDTILLQIGTSIELRARSDAALLTSVVANAAPGAVGLAIDGSYAWAKTTTKLRAWSTTGQLLVDRNGNYASASVIGAPGELRVGKGPAGAQVIQTISTATNMSTTTPAFIGEFQRWFADGERFMASASTVMRVYSRAAAALQLVQLPGPISTTYVTPFGYGDNYAVATSGSGGGLHIYRLGETTPALTLANSYGAMPSGRILGIKGPTYVDVIDLSLPTLTTTRHPVPRMGGGGGLHGDSPASWVVAAGQAVIYDSDNLAHPDGPRSLNCGTIASIAGSDAGIALATGAGQILYVEVSGGTRTLTAVVPLFSSKVELSSDGSVLAAAGMRWPDEDQPVGIGIYAMPSADVVHIWPAEEYLLQHDFTLARDGTHLGRGRAQLNPAPPPTPDFSITNLTGTVTYFADTENHATRMFLSPSGGRVALNDPYESWSHPEQGVVIYDGQTLVGAATESAMGWLDNGRLLVTEFVPHGWEDPIAHATRILDPSGAVLATLIQTIPFVEGGSSHHRERPRFALVTPTTIYLPERASIYSLVDGSLQWTSSYPLDYWPTDDYPSNVAAGHVVRVVGPLVTIETPP